MMNRLRNILRIGIGGLLLSACSQESAQLPDGTVTRDITVQVLPMQSFGNAAATRADLAMTAAEKVINKAYVVQFNGTAAGNTAVWVSPDVSAQLKTNSPVNCNFTLSGSKSRVYVIANPKTTPATGMSLSAFETVAYSVSASLPATGLPMVDSQDVSAGEMFRLFQLQSPLARLTFTTNTGSLSLRGIPSAYSLAPATPGSSPVRPSGITYTATASLASGTAYYVPSNLSGTVDLPDAIYRCSLVAPINSMYVVNTANGITYTTYLGSGTPSDFNVVSNYAYAVTANVYGSDGSDLRVGNPTNLALDAKGTANCYIAPCANMPCSFSATVMGNGRTTPAHTVGSVSGDIASPAIIPTTLTPASAEVLWETVNTSSSPSVGSVISDVSLSNGRVSFRAGTAQGNAVIAVKSGSTILWSWHIWRTNETPKEIGLKAIGSLTVDNELVMMDRNLGALSAAAGSDLSIGLHYQWGRKDPMPGYGTFGGGAMATQPAGFPFIPDASAQYTVAQSIQQPSTFFKYDSSPYDWCTPRTDNLWGTPLTEKVTVGSTFNSNPGMKSIYDPCPVGWRVPPGYAFVNAVKPTTAWDKGWNLTIGFGSVSSYFPASGFRYGNGTLSNVGAYGYYWTSAPNANDPAYGSSLNFSSGGVNPAGYYYRAYGVGCRCAKE